MHYAFQDSDNLYLIMDLMSGGDLRYHKSRHKKFSEEQTRFFICGIILALEYIHGNNVIHRDIKPENLVLDINGYVRLTDFGIAIINKDDNSKESSGTAGYMAPEVMLQQGHSYPADFFALGVIGYEFMIGNRPYYGKNRKQIKDFIMAYQAKIKFNNMKKGWSENSKDFINRLLQRRPVKRLGYTGIKELKNHLWLKDLDWDSLKKKKIRAPYIPKV
jgi:serine/threonine protein kinase